MKVFLLGATRGTGKEVLMTLIEYNHQVIALVRRPDAIKIADNNLQVIKGDIYNPDIYQDELSGCDVVISALGTGTSRKPTNVYSGGGQLLVSAMRKANKKRLITVTAAAFDPTDPATQSFPVKYIVQPLFKNIYDDMQRWEAILENSRDIDWTIVRPGRLTNGREKGHYRVQINHCPKGGGSISRKDLADFMVRQTGSEEYIHRKAVIAY